MLTIIVKGCQIFSVPPTYVHTQCLGPGDLISESVAPAITGSKRINLGPLAPGHASLERQQQADGEYKLVRAPVNYQAQYSFYEPGRAGRVAYLILAQDLPFYLGLKGSWRDNQIPKAEYFCLCSLLEKFQELVFIFELLIPSSDSSLHT